MPKCSSRGTPFLMTSSATSTTAPSTQPPDTAPETSPSDDTAIFAPGGRGAERFTFTTVASATDWPPATQPSTSSSTSRSLIRALLRAGPPVAGSFESHFKQLGELLERLDRVAGQEVVHVWQRCLHAARQRLVVAARLERVEPHEAVRAARQALHLQLEQDRVAAVPSVGQHHHDRATTDVARVVAVQGG